MRDLTSSQLAAALGVSRGTIGYHARRDRLPHDTTLGGHRRYDLAEVRAVLADDRDDDNRSEDDRDDAARRAALVERFRDGKGVDVALLRDADRTIWKLE